MSQAVPPLPEGQSLEERYGSTRRNRLDRRFAWVIAGLLVAAGIAFLLFSGWQGQNRVSMQDIGYADVDENLIDVKFEVHTPSDTSVACAIEALDTSKATIGWKVVEIPASERREHTVTTRLVTTGPATAATARSCWVLE